MLDRFIKYITDKDLIKPDQKNLLAISGGVDSMVMMDLFHKKKIPFAVAHCNFNLRGEESNEDEVFVSEFARNNHFIFHLKRFETEEYANSNSLSIEMAARKLRYDYFEELCDNYAYDNIVTAHHKDDLIETFFINLTRKTGIKGLSGIKSRNGRIIRPMLFAGRKEILEYAMLNKIPFREDSSNNSLIYRRNFIRHTIIPVFEEINPSFRNNVVETILHLKEVEDVYQEAVKKEKETIFAKQDHFFKIDITGLLKTSYPKVLLFEILSEFAFNSSVVNEIFESLLQESGKQFFSPDYRVVKDRNELIITCRESSSSSLFYIEKEDIELFEPVHLEVKTEDNIDFKIPKYPRIACLDFDKLEFPLTIRKWAKGEYFKPLGMQGFKKISDYFIDEKMSIPEKENTWIIYSSSKVVWIIGKRIDDRFKVTSKTKKIYIMEEIDHHY